MVNVDKIGKNNIEKNKKKRSYCNSYQMYDSIRPSYGH